MSFKRSLAFLVYAAIISGISLYGIWICLYAGIPKVAFWFIAMNEPMILPEPASWVFANGEELITLFWPTVILVSILPLIVLIPAIPVLLRTVARMTLIALSIVLALGVSVLYLSLLIGAHEAYFGQDHRARLYAGVLEEFALREAAEDRLHQIQARMAALTSRVQIAVTSADQLSPSDRKRRLSQLVSVLQEGSSPEIQKRALATFGLFRNDLVKDRKKEEIVVKSASVLTGQTFSSSAEFFTWLDANIGRDGWEPIPLHTFVIVNESAPRKR